jgi:hypothetical protein
MSGLAVSALVVAVLLVVVAVVGPWYVLLAPLALGVLGAARIKPAEQRGRGLAIAAAVISAAFAVYGFVAHRQGRAEVRDLAVHVLTALREENLKDLEPWLDPEVVKEGAAARMAERHAKVVEAVGRFRGEVEAGNALLGMTPTFLPPSGLSEIGGTTGRPDGSDLPPGGAYWVKARFERATLDVAIVVRGGGRDAIMNVAKEMQGIGTKVVSDVRYFRKGSEAGR